MNSTAIAGDDLLRDCARFLVAEAAALDRREFQDWLTLLSRRIDYAIPVRVTHSLGKEFSDSAFFMKEDFGSLILRLKRLESAYAWAENPPTRTRRLVSNFRLLTQDSPVDAAREGIMVASNFAVLCYRGDETVPKILSGERQDLLVREEGQLKLAKRLVLLDSTVIGLGSLSIFL
nr:aromatic-ring-hydroxylating dioxygenase subunit beta [Nitrosomonas nitrosa]